MEELERNIEQKKLEAENARAEAVQKETTDHVSWPVRIDIGVEDLKSCFDQVRKISTEQEEAQNREDEARKNEQKRGRSLEEREKAVERKEEVIEQTIENLEKISETIKERIRILEERERQIELKGKNRDTDMENENRREIEQQLYEMIFQSPDLLDDEVKLKDDTREVIINKDDLLEIRQMIEANIDAE
ncbi:MAG TPA: hypothetical protein DHN33_08090, partial [Eubacteriaceae bacterium]|nr:hypothetical protein [Eubacteriaceae bacterium]